MKYKVIYLQTTEVKCLVEAASPADAKNWCLDGGNGEKESVIDIKRKVISIECVEQTAVDCRKE